MTQSGGRLRRLAFGDWAQGYDRATLASDLLAAVIVTLMLIPQSLAYAGLAGLPPQAGLYASIAPLVLYGLLGSSRVLAVGPVAVVSLMTATAIGEHAVPGTSAHAQSALVLALLSGGVLLLMGSLRLGFLANFLSHPVISGFVTASALLIAAGQMRVVLGLPGKGADFPSLLADFVRHGSELHGPTAVVGVAMLAFLVGVRRGLKPALRRLGLGVRSAELASRAGPVAGIALAALAVHLTGGEDAGVKVVGVVPASLPPLTVPPFDAGLWRELAVPAILIGVVGFVESVSVGRTLAARRRERIDPDRELVALGASNAAAAFTGGFPVTGGFARSVVNFDAGARTPAAGLFTAVGILLATLFLTPALHHVPQAALSATIVVAVLSLVDVEVFRRTWRFSRSDFAAAVVTLATTLAAGVESGLTAGVAVSLGLLLFRTSRPHIAEVGLVPGTEHFRNVLRHQVLTSPRLLTLRVDESLCFANAQTLEDRVNEAVASRPALRHVVLQCSAINDVDASALESLEAIDQRLGEAGIALHLSEVKGPVMDRLRSTELLGHLRGEVFLSQYQAVQALAPELLAHPPAA